MLDLPVFCRFLEGKADARAEHFEPTRQQTNIVDALAISVCGLWDVLNTAWFHNVYWVSYVLVERHMLARCVCVKFCRVMCCHDF